MTNATAHRKHAFFKAGKKRVIRTLCSLLPAYGLPDRCKILKLDAGGKQFVPSMSLDLYKITSHFSLDEDI